MNILINLYDQFKKIRENAEDQIQDSLQVANQLQDTFYKLFTPEGYY